MAVSDFLIIGGGIVGLTIGIEVKKAFGGSVCILEKEEHIGAHASGRNSGVLHAGIYYKPGTLKGRLCVEGNRVMRNYCNEKGLSQVKGKVIVTRSDEQLDSLLELEKRAKANGASAQLIDEDELKEIEPHAQTVRHALYSPNTITIDPNEVLKEQLKDAKSLGIRISFDTKLVGLGEENKIQTNKGKLGYGYLINAAGAYADKIAHMFGVGKQFVMLPYKGVYCRLKPECSNLVRSNIYPVPDIRYPFLGVHFTKTPGNIVKIGPTAIPALAKENYHILDNIKFDEFIDTVRYNLVQLFKDKNYLSLATKEVSKYIPYLYYKDAKRLLPKIEYSHIASYPHTGIRPQLFNKETKQLENDFMIKKLGNTLHILNAVSPAFTTSIAFARHITEIMKTDSSLE